MPVHVHPEHDIVDHELTERCVCGPRVDALDGSEYPNGPLYIHHSLDENDDEKLGWLCTEVKPC